jgi:hypothetical protein
MQSVISKFLSLVSYEMRLVKPCFNSLLLSFNNVWVNHVLLPTHHFQAPGFTGS